MSSKHRGIIVPMATPVTSAGTMDEAAVRRIVSNFAANEIHCFVLGTTGEAPSVPPAERQRLVDIAVDEAAGRILVYAGIGDNCAATAIASGRRYLESGVDAVVALLPSYYPLNAAEMRAYFRHLAAEIEGSIVIYNIPPTTHMSIPLDVVEELSHLPNITGYKDSENDLARIQTVAERLCGRKDFSVFMGVAAHTARALKLGYDGSVPSSGNLTPALWRDLYQAALHEEWENAEALQLRLDALGAVIQGQRSLGQSLAALKAAMNSVGLCEPHMLPPLQELPAAEREAIGTAISTYVFSDSPAA